MTEVQINRVLPCDCGCASHVRVVLYEPKCVKYLHVRIDAEAGYAILGELNGLTSSCTEGLDLLKSVFSAVGFQAERLIFCNKGQKWSVSLQVRLWNETREVAVEPCSGLLAACRLKVPVFVRSSEEQEPPVEDLPAVYQPLMEELDLDRLEQGQG